MGNCIVEVKNVSKKYIIDCEQNDVIDKMNFTVHNGEFVCIVGYTGCGKSTLLRLLGGFEKPDEGEIYFNGQLHTHPTKDMIMIFQDFNQLFPWKTACGNIVHALMKTGIIRNKREATIEAKSILDDMGLNGFHNYYPHQLSGGMKQRVAVGRAIALKPKLLLMDEPFAALDEVNRFKLQQLCRKLYLDRGISIVFVTHSIGEAVALAERIVVMGRCKGNILADIKNTSIDSNEYKGAAQIREQVLTVLKENIKNF